MYHLPPRSATPGNPSTAQSVQNKKPTFGLVTEVGCFAFDLLSSYLAITPHLGNLL